MMQLPQWALDSSVLEFDLDLLIRLLMIGVKSKINDKRGIALKKIWMAGRSEKVDRK